MIVSVGRFALSKPLIMRVGRDHAALPFSFSGGWTGTTLDAARSARLASSKLLSSGAKPKRMAILMIVDAGSPNFLERRRISLCNFWSSDRGIMGSLRGAFMCPAIPGNPAKKCNQIFVDSAYIAPITENR